MFLSFVVSSLKGVLFCYQYGESASLCTAGMAHPSLYYPWIYGHYHSEKYTVLNFINRDISLKLKLCRPTLVVHVVMF
jgi:hypothetical protein